MTSAHTSGTILRGRDLGGISVEEVLMPSGLCVPEHSHDGAQIYFVLEGEYAEDEHALGPGSAWFRPPHQSHHNEVLGTDAALTLIVTIDENRFARTQRRTTSGRELHSLLLGETRSELLRELRDADDETATALEGWSLVLLSRVERALTGMPPSKPEWLNDAVSFMERCYRQPLSLSGIAAHVAVHPATLAAAFRRFHQTSVGEYLRGLRLDYARDALLHTPRPIKEIALDAGFYDQAHFGRHFKRRFGTSPAKLRAYQP
ncbi:MAG TPA: AraC family transcriptional regulator [Thermoanaerobaculia bacterium]|nr:AraC family transcriptional regulator [Thermoanaerobaculia bacterium]